MKKLILILIFGFIGLLSWSQTNPMVPKSGKVIFLYGDTANIDSTKIQVYKVLVRNAPVTNEFMNLPRFCLVGKEKKFYFSISAVLKATASFDWGNPLNSASDFIIENITPKAPGNGGQFLSTVQQSHLDFNVVGLPGRLQQFGCYLSLKFNGNGNSYAVKLDHAYVNFFNFTVGYTNSIFCDGAAHPYTVDCQGPNAEITTTNGGIRYQKGFKNGLKIGAAFELPMVSYTPYAETPTITTEAPTGITTQRIPDVPLYIQYAWSSTSHIRLSSIFRCLTYRDIVAQKNYNNFGYGIKLSGTITTKPVIAYFEATAGQGVASYLQDNTNHGLDMTPDPNDLGRLNNTTSWGAMGALQFNFTKTLFSTIAYSQVRNYMDYYTQGQIAYDNHYKYGQYGAVNIIWSPTSFFVVGLEYLYGRRTLNSGDHYSDNRIQAMTLFSF